MKYNNFKWSHEDLITQSRFVDLAKANSDTHVFIKTDYIENRYISNTGNSDINALATIWDVNVNPMFPPKQRNWITGNSDYHITELNSEHYTGSFDNWYGINMGQTGPKFHTIPIGVETNQMDVIYQVSQEPRILSTELAYMNFNVYTYVSERAIVDLMFKDKSWVKNDINKRLEISEFYRNIRNHKFTFCPRGNGVDTHRLWETLYLGSIPVVNDHPDMEPFFSRLPVVKIKNWLNLTDNYLEMEYERIMEYDGWEFDMLKMNYWKNFILNKDA
jgi:hypothetical protein